MDAAAGSAPTRRVAGRSSPEAVAGRGGEHAGVEPGGRSPGEAGRAELPIDLHLHRLTAVVPGSHPLTSSPHRRMTRRSMSEAPEGGSIGSTSRPIPVSRPAAASPGPGSRDRQAARSRYPSAPSIA